jgi:protein-S-isoprenylcysteine O-methyltransferase Ste14
MLLSHFVLAVLWIVYCVLHSVLAGRDVKQKLQAAMGKNYKHYRLIYTVFAFLFFVAVIYYEIRVSTIQLFDRSSFILFSGVLIGAAGLLLMAICIRKYFVSLSGLRSVFEENVSNSLIITGIHRYIRHPLYLGTFAFIWGLFLVLPFLSLLISNAIITIYTLIGIELEEKKLVMEFGETYQRYQHSVPKLIPLSRRKQSED